MTGQNRIIQIHHTATASFAQAEPLESRYHSGTKLLAFPRVFRTRPIIKPKVIQPLVVIAATSLIVAEGPRALSLRTLLLSATSRAMRAMVCNIGGIMTIFEDAKGLNCSSRSCKACNVMIPRSVARAGPWPGLVVLARVYRRD